MDASNAPENENLAELKVENDVDEPIEIADSDDEENENQQLQEANVNSESDGAESNEPDLNKGTAVAAPIRNRDQPMPSSNAQNQVKRNAKGLYKCNQCGYASKYRHIVKRHQLTHDSAMPFECEHCTYACRRKDQLKVHQYRMHRRK